MNKSYTEETYYENQERVHLPKNRRWQYTPYGRHLHNELKQIYLTKQKQDETNEQCSSMMTNDLKQSFQFKIASYNLLAPSLLSQNFYLYQDINQSYTDWNYRKSKLYDEIKQFKADIYCFQEMQEDQYLDYFLPRFKQLGYKCYFKKRYGNEKLDGCCIIFKWRKFRLIKLECIDFFVSNVPILNRENVGITLLLEPKYESLQNKKICVATTHILFNPKRGDCKLAQMQYFLSHIDLMAFKEMKKIDSKIINIYHPVILCGDFNCDFRSKFYEFIRNGKLSDYRNLNRILLSGQLNYTSSHIGIDENLLALGEHLNINDQCQFKLEVMKRYDSFKSEQKEEPNLNHDGLDLRHMFNFDSVYKHHADNMALEITTCLRDTKKTVDYIFFHANEILNENTAQLKLLGRLELFKTHQIQHVYSLPIKNYPSDHFMIAAKFEII